MILSVLHKGWLILLLLLTISMHQIKKKLEFSAADTEPITNLRREGKAYKLKLLIKILSSQNLSLYLITKKANQLHLRQ